MPSYICEKCGYIDNSACGGNYWIAKMNQYRKREGREIDKYFDDEDANIKLLCFNCTPKVYHDGSIKSDNGVHLDTRRHWSDIGKEQILASAEASMGNFTNAKEFFSNLKETDLAFKKQDS